MDNMENVPNMNQPDLNNMNTIPNNPPIPNNGMIMNNNPVPVEPVAPNISANEQPAINNQVVLGTVSNVTYNDTVGNVFNNQEPTPNMEATQNTFIPEQPANATQNTFIPNPQLEKMQSTVIPEQNMANRMNEEPSPYLNDMNVNDPYNNLANPTAPSYVNDPQVADNVAIATGQKKATVPISKELKTVIIIVVVLLAFIVIMPNIMDLFNKIRFR